MAFRGGGALKWWISSLVNVVVTLYFPFSESLVTSVKLALVLRERLYGLDLSNKDE